MSKGRSINQLDHSEFYRLCEAIKAEKTRYEKETPRYEQVAKEMTNTLGYRVTEQNIVKVLKVLGWTWKAKRQGSATHRNQYGRILAQAVKELYTAFNEIAGQLGVAKLEIPFDLQRIIRGLPLEGEAAENKESPPPLPVSRVPDPCKIPVVNSSQS